MSDIQPIRANSRDGGDTYRLLVMVHSMAGSLANSTRKEFTLARTNSDPMFGPIITAWTNGIVDIENLQRSLANKPLAQRVGIMIVINKLKAEKGMTA